MERLSIKKFTVPVIVLVVAWGCNHYSAGKPVARAAAKRTAIICAGPNRPLAK